MKVLAFLAVAVISISAQARSIQAEKIETLNQVSIDGVATDLTGLLAISFIKNEIRVDLFNDPCGQLQPPQPGVFRCMAAATLKHSFMVPLKTRANDGCGSIAYIGSENLMPVDGLLTQVNVTDNSRRYCENVVLSSLIVEIRETNAWNGKTTVYTLMK